MTTNITDVNAFTSPIVVPSNGEAANVASVITAFQGLSNRTFYNSNRLDAIEAATPHISGVFDGGQTLAQNEVFALTADDTQGGMVLGTFETGHDITVPSDGIYSVCFSSYLTNDSTANPRAIVLELRVNDVNKHRAFGVRFSASASDSVQASGAVAVALAASDVLHFESTGGGNTSTHSAGQEYWSHFSVTKIGNV